MRLSLILGVLVVSCALAHYILPNTSIDNVLSRFRNAYRYLEQTLGKQSLLNKGIYQVVYPTPTIKSGDCFDFIIVGGGSAGCVLANRLSENPKWQVLLIETGHEADALTNVPSLGAIFSNTEISQKYSTDSCATTTLQWSYGQALGGSSVMDGMIVDRGCSAEFDLLAAEGNTGWAFNDVLNYFQISESANVGDRAKIRGTCGPLSVEKVNSPSKVASLFIKAAESLGYHEGNRNNGHGTVSTIEKFSLNGLRYSAEKGYLQTITDRANLKILKDHQAFQISFNTESSPRATGLRLVNLITKNELSLKINKEIVITSGAFNAPKLLMHSGVGPADVLDTYNIPLVKDLPVAQTFFDQFIAPVSYFRIDGANLTRDSNEFLDPNQLEQLILNCNGPLTSSLGHEATAHYRSPSFTGPEPITDIQFKLTSANLFQAAPVFEKISTLRPSIYQQLALEYQGCNNIFSVATLLALPNSAGSLELASDSIYDSLRIPNLFDASSDMERIIEGIRELQNIMNTTVCQQYRVEPVFLQLEECKDTEINSDEYWACLVQNMITPANNAGGTCKMGPDTDETAVVDSNLKVKGLQNVRVVGNAALPHPISASGSAVTIMMAEKAAYLAIKSWA